MQMDRQIDNIQYVFYKNFFESNITPLKSTIENLIFKILGQNFKPRFFCMNQHSPLTPKIPFEVVLDAYNCFYGQNSDKNDIYVDR